MGGGMDRRSCDEDDSYRWRNHSCTTPEDRISNCRSEETLEGLIALARARIDDLKAERRLAAELATRQAAYDAELQLAQEELRRKHGLK